MIQEYFIPELERLVGAEISKQILQQDGAPAHTSNYTLDILKSYFNKNLISIR